VGEEDALVQEDGVKTDDQVSESQDDGEGTGEVEIVRQTDAGSQPDINQVVQKRVNRLNVQKREVLDDNAELRAENERLRQKSVLLDHALQLSNDPPAGAPDPDDFDDGRQDRRFIEADKEHRQKEIGEAVKSQLAEITASQTGRVDPRVLEAAQTRHYERADKMGAKDFEATEDKALAVLGTDTVNYIIRKSRDSERILYFLGKNPGELENFKSLCVTDPEAAMIEVGRLGAEVKVKRGANVEPAPNPDVAIEGGNVSPPKISRHQRAVDKEREKAAETRKMGPLLEAKRKAAEAGVTII
jgi:hypothetical protein